MTSTQESFHNPHQLARVFGDAMRRYMREFWEFMAFLANSMIFLLMGLTEYHLFADLGNSRELVAIMISLTGFRMAQFALILMS